MTLRRSEGDEGMNNQDKLEKIIAHYGHEEQLWQCVEELTECSLALMHHAKDKYSNHHEEIADALIMLEQMRLIYGPRNIDALIEMKLDRTMQRIEDVNSGS